MNKKENTSNTSNTTNKNEKVSKYFNPRTQIEYVHIQNSIFSILCKKLNSFYNRLPILMGDVKDFNNAHGLGVWSYHVQRDRAKLLQNPDNYGPLSSSKNNKKFIKSNTELIENCIRHFVRIVSVEFPNFHLKKEYEFVIDTNPFRISTSYFHRDGGEEFLLFIYPKTNPVGTYFSGPHTEGDQDTVHQSMKKLPSVKQCDAIMIHNTRVTHATPVNFRETSNENLSFIRISMREI